MKQKLGQLQSKRDELVARSRTAAARHRMADAVRSVDVLDPTGDLGRFEDKVRREEARAAGRQELAASSLDAQFESLDSLSDSAEVDARLARLKSGAA
jgi:phage shock protein A